MKIKVGSLYRTLFRDYSGVYQEAIFKVLDYDFEHHKGYYEYLIKAVVPNNFSVVADTNSDTMWIKSNFLSKCEELPKNHPANLLYGKGK